MNIRNALGGLSLALALTACGSNGPVGPATGAAPSPSQTAPTERVRAAAPLLRSDDPAALPGQYIVVLSEGYSGSISAQDAAGLMTQLSLDPAGARIQNIYTQALRGFSAELSEQNLAALQANPAVKYIEQDTRVSASAVQSSPKNWGLDRIDQRGLPLSGSYSYSSTGRGVTAYIVDSGINTYHEDFGGRASWGGNATGDGKNYDCNSHGTHVAGTVGGTRMGVAKDVKLVGVKVLGCDGFGSTSGIVAGLDWVRGQTTSGRKVINISINGTGSSQAYADAIGRLATAGVPVVNSAANKNDNACYYGPADVSAAIVVAATDSRDRRASFSNYGSCVDLFAPGVDILSASSSNNSGYIYMSGTSMAAPHVAGAVARILESQPTLTVAQVERLLIDTSTKNVVSDPAGSPNRLLFLGETGTAPAPAPTPDDLPNAYNASMSAGQYGYVPGEEGAWKSGTIKAVLTASAGTDFDLYLERWNGSAWVTVAKSENPDSNESITYTGTAGYYRTEVYAYAGSGSFTLKTN
ncbi:S8 family peptidase [Deinococcus lacus]|uniref:S8 family peptidase n=1 Tax=Deinococcus lacus TaxID=392561 RepID=A0ABW1YGM0_9DEIO